MVLAPACRTDLIVNERHRRLNFLIIDVVYSYSQYCSRSVLAYFPVY